MKESFIDELCIHLRAGTPIISVNTDETVRLIGEVKRAAWKTGDGAELTFESEDEIKVLQNVISRHAESSEFIKVNKKGERVVVYDSSKLVALMQKIDAKFAAEDNKVKQEKLDNDQQTIERLLNSACQVVEWNLIDGYVGMDGFCADRLDDAFKAARADHEQTKLPRNCVLVFRDAHHFLNTQADPTYREILRNLVEGNLLVGNGCTRHIVFVQPDWTPHRDIQNCLTVMEFSLPTEEQLNHEINYVIHSIDDPTKRHIDDDLRSELCRAMRGFTQTEAVNALSVCVAKHRGFVPETISTIHRLQRATFSKTGVLTMIDDDEIEDIDSVGGFEQYMGFVEEAMLTYTPEAKILGMTKPKGCLLLGVPGTGKSLVARVTAKKMKLPLLIYDFGAQFGSLVGQTESTQRQVLKQITAKGPCVVLLDEADKLFSGVVGGYQGDSGVNTRSFGTLLSWMANDNEEAFVILTMNRTLGIPPEMLRAGRLDAIYYTTFPTPRERLDILGIHLKKNGADIDSYTKSDLEKVIKATDDYVGSEIEQLVKKAVRVAAKKNHPAIKDALKKHPNMKDEDLNQLRKKFYSPTAAELIAATKVITPVAKLDHANIQAIEKFCKENATPVSSEAGESRVFRGRNIKLGPSLN